MHLMFPYLPHLGTRSPQVYLLPTSFMPYEEGIVQFRCWEVLNGGGQTSSTSCTYCSRVVFFSPVKLRLENDMLDFFTIFTVGGLVLWSQEWTKLRGNPINELIKKVFLEVCSGFAMFFLSPEGS